MRAVLAVLLGIAVSCATMTTIAKSTGDCAAPKLAALVPRLLPVVVAVLAAPGAGKAVAALAALEPLVEGGAAVVVCAVDAALGQAELALRGKLAIQPSPTDPTASNARDYLSAQGFVHAAAP